MFEESENKGKEVKDQSEESAKKKEEKMSQSIWTVIT